MADLTLPNDLGSQIQGLLSQFQPSQAMLDAANKRAKLDFFLGLLGAPRGGEFAQAGRSGLLALQDRDNYIKTQQGLTAQNLQLAMPLLQMARQQQMMQQYQSILGGGTPTANGPPDAFQAPGGASALMNGAAAGQPAPTNALPTQVPDPAAMQDRYSQLAKLNFAGRAVGMPDMSEPLKTLYPQAQNARPGTFNRLPNGQMSFNPVMPPGYMPVDPNNPMRGMVPIPGYQGAQLAQAAIPKAVDVSYTPQTGVLPGGGTGVVGSQAGALFPDGRFPFLSQQGPAPSAQPAQQPQGPVQTKLSPEQETNSKALGDQGAEYRTAMDQSSKAIAQLDQINDTLKYFKPGPTLPMRAGIAGYAQEIPGIGRSVADALVPNSQTALPAIAAMEKFGVGLTAEQSKVFGSREGQQVIGMIKSAMPNAAQVPGAPETIIAAQKGVHQWIIDKALGARQWVAAPSHNGSLDGFSEAWDASHPVSSYVGNLPALAALAGGKSPQSGAPATQATSAPPAAIQYLRAHPELRAQFDQKYGSGASAGVLGR